MADVAKLVGEVEGGQAAAADEARRAQEAAEAAAAWDEALLAAVKVGESEVASRSKEASANAGLARLEEEINMARSGAVNAKKRAKYLEKNLEKVRNSCFEFQPRAVTAEGGQAAATDEASRAQDAAEAAAARDEALLAAVKVGESEIASRTKEADLHRRK